MQMFQQEQPQAAPFQEEKNITPIMHSTVKSLAVPPWYVSVQASVSKCDLEESTALHKRISQGIVRSNLRLTPFCFSESIPLL